MARKPKDLHPESALSASTAIGDILLEAHVLINGERQGEYGDPVESFEGIAALWAAYLGTPITPQNVVLCLALLKIGRESYAHKHDNLLDAAGYIGIASEVSEV